MAPKILVVLTSHATVDNTDMPAGWFFPEFAHPYEILSSKAEIITASPKGGHAPLNQNSLKGYIDDPASKSFYETQKPLWENTQVLSSLVGRSSEFDAIFFPGGHGPMFDLVSDEHSIALIKEFYQAGKPVAAVCHGPAALLNVEIDGRPLVSGKEVTGFSNDEENVAGMAKDMPFLLETALGEKGGKYTKAGEPLAPKVVVDGQIITGGNPASAKPVGEALAKALGL